MGCDIHSFAERRVGDKYETATGRMFKEGSEPFGWRCYGMFGFLAGVRNCSAVTPIAKARGLPGAARGLAPMTEPVDDPMLRLQHSWIARLFGL